MRRNYFQNNIPLEKELVPAQKCSDLEHSADIPKEENPDISAETEKLTSRIEKEDALERIKVMEGARSERLDILGGLFSRLKDSIEVAKEKIGVNKLKEKIDEKLPKPAQELLSQMMDVSSLKMYAEAGSGKNLTGENLRPMDRILSALSGATNDIAKGLFAYAASSGSEEYAQLGGIAYGTSWALLLAKNGSKMMQNLKELASHYNIDNVDSVLVKIEETFKKYRYPGFEGKFEAIRN